ncbi:MAG: hypothetical protein ABSE57_21170 [Bryobacteraceae bacterium]
MTDENRLVFKEDLGDQSEIVATHIENGISHLAAFATQHHPSKALSTFVPYFLPASNSFFRLMMCNAFDRLQDQGVT